MAAIKKANSIGDVNDSFWLLDGPGVMVVV
jgi:hypothetical protein